MGSATCRNCGHPLRAGIRICTNCGTPITASQDPAARIPTAPPVPQPPPTDPLGPATSGGPTPGGPPSGKVIRLKTAHLAVLGAVTALLLVGAVAAGAMSRPKEEVRTVSGELVGQLPFDTDGGTESFDGGAGKIKVPEGALDAPATIEVRRNPVRQRVTGSSPTGTTLVFPPGALVVYTFGPTTLTFNRPVTITLDLPVTGQSGVIFVTRDGQIRFFSGTVDGGSIRIQLNSFDLSDPDAIIRT
jgi:hypothetical protein